MDNLIFDRLRSDVEKALDRTNSSSNLKGAYNYTDLNRVETWCGYLQDILNSYGAQLKLTIKVNWNMRDYPTRLNIDRIRNNIATLRSTCYAIMSSEIIESNNTLNYEQANILEKILFDIDKYIEDITKTINLNCSLGSALIGIKFTEMSVNTDGINEGKKVSILNEVGTFLCTRKYITMKGA